MRVELRRRSATSSDGACNGAAGIFPASPDLAYQTGAGDCVDNPHEPAAGLYNGTEQ